MVFLAFIMFFFFLPCVLGSHVLEVNDHDFDQKIGEFETAMVMFYAPWCGWCKRLLPDFRNAAERLKDDFPNKALFMINCTTSGRNTCAQFGVHRYPTLKIFHKGEFIENYYGRKREEIFNDMASFSN